MDYTSEELLAGFGGALSLCGIIRRVILQLMIVHVQRWFSYRRIVVMFSDLPSWW